MNVDAQSAKEILLLASSKEEQKKWVVRLARKVAEMGIVSEKSSTGDRDRMSIGSVFIGFCFIRKRGSLEGCIPACQDGTVVVLASPSASQGCILRKQHYIHGWEVVVRVIT